MRRVFLLAVVVAMAMGSMAPGRAEENVLRLGMIGLDTSHVIAFTRYINDPKNKTGCRVVVGYPGGSPDLPASADRVEKFTKQLREQHGLEIVGTIEELCEKVDGVLLESVDGRPHLKQVIPVIAARKPVFIDKPMAGNLSDVLEIFRLARENNVPCWSSSAYRYGKGIAGMRGNKEAGDIIGCDVFGSSSWAEHHPDLYLYGVHAVEALFTVMGPGCETVRRVKAKGTDMVVGVWKDGRIGTFRDLGKGKSDALAYVYTTKGMTRGESSGYGPLIDQIVTFFKTGKPPVPPEETMEIFAFMSAADVSKAREGAPVSLAALMDEAGKKREGK